MERKAPYKLVTSVEELFELYEVTEDVASTPAWDFMWGTTVEEGREKQFRSQAFTKEADRMYEGTTDEKVQLAQAAMKVCIFIIVVRTDIDSFERWSSAHLASSTIPILPLVYFIALGTSVSLLQDPISYSKAFCQRLCEIRRNRSQAGCSRFQTCK